MIINISCVPLMSARPDVLNPAYVVIKQAFTSSCSRPDTHHTPDERFVTLWVCAVFSAFVTHRIFMSVLCFLLSPLSHHCFKPPCWTSLPSPVCYRPSTNPPSGNLSPLKAPPASSSPSQHSAGLCWQTAVCRTSAVPQN